MKKTVALILCIVVIIISIFCTKYIDYKSEISSIKKENLEYETYLNKQIIGNELTTVINRAVDSNEKNSVSKDEQGLYIENDINSVKIDIKIIDNNQIYKMETLYNGGMMNFIRYYGNIYFECTKIDYNSKGRVCYIVFEQKAS